MEKKEALDKLPWDGEEKIFDELKKADDANLHHGRCEMGGYRINIMIRKGVEIKKNTYEIMKGFQHQTCIPHLDFYPEGNMGRLVVPRVEQSFDKWIRNRRELLFDVQHGSMSLLFKTMIFDLCDLVEKLCGSRILIKNLHLKNLYVANEITPRLLVLITEAEQKLEFSRMELWKPVNDLLEDIFTKCKVVLNHEAKRFIGFIITDNFTTKNLKSYPLDWDIQTKQDYLLALAAKQGCIRSRLFHKGIAWPLVNRKMPDILDQIIIHQSSRSQPVEYSPKIPIDYIRLIRDTFKHFDKFPHHIKIGRAEVVYEKYKLLEQSTDREFGNHRYGFIGCIEKWSPDIWKDIYDIIGWP